MVSILLLPESFAEHPQRGLAVYLRIRWSMLRPNNEEPQAGG
jgi:hypothetical protein